MPLVINGPRSPRARLSLSGFAMNRINYIVMSRVWGRLREGGFLSARELADKLQINEALIGSALEELIARGKVEERAYLGRSLFAKAPD